jgi:hypothetical protein
MLKQLPVAILLVAGCANAEASRAPSSSAKSDLAPYAAWRVTAGKLDPGPDGTLLIREGSVRAELQHTADAATLEFAYVGPTPHPERLASGELRRQIGLKLRAQDTCNVVYVMWHIDPTPRIEVAVKHNPGLHVHPACRDHGYTFVAPERSAPVAAIQPDTWHSLSAQLRGRSLDVSADGILAWRGALPDAAFAFDGPIGLRSDNGRFRLRFKSDFVD